MKITFRNITTITLVQQGIGTLLLIFILIFFGKDIFSSTITIVTFSITIFPLYLSSFYFQIEYYFRNRGMELSIENESFILKKSGNYNVIKFEDIKYIIMYPSGTHKGESLMAAATTWRLGSCYHYMRIVTYSNEETIITCLMNPRLYELFDSFDGVKTYKLYPWFPSTFIK